MIASRAVEATAGHSTFVAFIEDTARAFEALGAAILIMGVFWSVMLAVVAWRRGGGGRGAYTAVRQAFGGALLLSLEVLVAADLLRTVAIAPTLENVGVLGLIVLIRTFLSISIETEIEGVPPWRRALGSGAGTIRRATQSTLGQPPR
jgi:uncharacterized membrane protein